MGEKRPFLREFHYRRIGRLGRIFGTEYSVFGRTLTTDMIFVSISFSIANTAIQKAPFATIMVMLSSQRR